MTGQSAPIGDVLEEATLRLREAGVEMPGREARLLLANAAKLQESTILGWPERMLTDHAKARFREILTRRVRGEPMSRIIGKRGFWTLDLALGPTLDPRPDTETVVEAVLERIPDRHTIIRILDLGTGTGAILLALLKEFPGAFGIGIDREPAALAIAAANAAANDLERRAAFAAMDWGEALSGSFDVIVSNPPYIPTAAISGLQPEVRDHDPWLALDGGPDGLTAYRQLAVALPRMMNGGAFACLEVGAGQAIAVASLFEATGLQVADIRADLAGIPRAITVRSAQTAK